MNGRQKSDGWTEVRQKKPPTQAPHADAGCVRTNYYVSGFPGDTKKEELRKAFAKFGNVVDVYMGGKTDRYKRNFAFVRFTGVKDVKALEDELQIIKLKGVLLLVNIEKHKRKLSQHHAIPSRQQNVTPRYVPIHQSYRNGDSRSFAQVAAGVSNSHNKPPSPPMILNSNTCIREWLKKNVLIGEVHQFENLHCLFTFTEKGVITKYLGGLRVALHFDQTSNASKFLEDEPAWKEWFQWLTHGDKLDIKYERIAWMKILGLPLKLWDESNFSTIVRTFGKIVRSCDCIADRRDYSIDKVGVLTSNTKWINEEISVFAEGKLFTVGVVEYTNDWSAFKTPPLDHMEYESEDEVTDNDDEDGISDTCMNFNDNDLEEGEIHPNNEHSCVGGDDSGESPVAETSMDSPSNTPSITLEATRSLVATPLMPHTEASFGIPNASEPTVASLIPDPDVVDPSKYPVCSNPTPIINSNLAHTPIQSISTFGPLDNAIPLHNVVSSGSKTPIEAEPKHKKRKRLRSATRSPHASSIPPPSMCPHSSSTISVSIPPAFDLNQNPPTNSTSSDTPDIDVDDVGCLHLELLQTVEIGKKLGFQIKDNNKILAQVIGEIGDIDCDK
ncbi:unnamed protein product [Lactuca virosa]|uniref:RRM domain-containing protein n=1 Tax=Lactuca virosa TaxID=75947 RepID=A0AAU9NW35_9ASTR|nr:unnamed protein product [Lactuca virosa]